MKMKKTNYLRFLKIGVFFLGISLFVLGCQQEDKSLENNQTSDFDTPFKTITYQKAINKKTFKTITENSKIKTFFETNNYKSKSNSKEQNYSVVKETVKIIEKKDYISYTFLLNNNEKSTNSSFSNLVIEKKKKAIRAYIINYIPSQEFLTSKNKPFSGRISVKRIEYDETLLSRESDCGWVDNYTRRNCTVHGTSGIYNPQCSNYGKDAFSYSSSFVCDLNGGGSIGNLTYFSNDNSTGGSNSADEDKSSTQTAPIFPCGDEIHGCDKEREEEQIINELIGKAKCVFEKLEKLSSGFKNVIQKFDGEFPVSHLKLTINNDLGSSVYGETQPPVNYLIEIQINNDGFSNLSDLGKAIAFSHEIIHAEIFRKMLSAAKRGDLSTSTMTVQESVDYVNSLRNNFPRIYDYYWEKYKPTWNHNMMASHYRITIADMIEEFDNNRLPRSTYEALAWVGLGKIEGNQTTTAWDNLTTGERHAIENLIEQNFFNGPSNCN